ncbi:glycoside hydrolase [Ascobolus immersus RN42]|uniref:Glycoside hydrolase n=1 Tax=Ascobolus immersus RN42 TaxID=1160509 RepID=A0A3N4III2_ASCIM|nr:glycoside hydrolase [Ascobolus immersus RN42]
MYPFNQLRETHFTLWTPGVALQGVNLILATVKNGSPISVVKKEPIPLKEIEAGLWTVPAKSAGLEKDTIYCYWFEVTDDTRSITVTDPFATSVDWRILSKPNSTKPRFDKADEEYYPAGVISWSGEKLQVADPVLEDITPTLLSITPYPEKDLPTNRQLVIYELPTAWVRPNKPGSRDESIGTFHDVYSLLSGEISGAFPDLEVLELEKPYIESLGVNSIEFLPLADSVYPRQWAYGTTNFNAPDYELGFSENYTHPAPNRDLANVVRAMHSRGIRLISDVVMGFAKRSPYRSFAFDTFFINAHGAPDSDPDKFNSRPNRGIRDGYGADLWRYAKEVTAYSPLTGKVETIYPGREYLLVCQERWMRDFQVGGFRLDSVENVYNWDFVQAFNESGRRLHLEREGATDEGYLCVGEELSEPRELFKQGRTTGIWREHYKAMVRDIIMGRAPGNFDDYVKKTIDSRRDGYDTLTNAVIFLTTHDVEGQGNERIYRYLKNNGLDHPTALRRVKLAFACLLTSVGIPLILAGDEFADDHDLLDANKNVTHEGGKQVDPVNFDRLARDDGRKAVKEYVSNLIKLRGNHPALGSDEVDFFWSDYNDGKRVVAWRRGPRENPVVVVANFSGWKSGDGNEYVVGNWPSVEGKSWKEAGLGRVVDKPGREGVFDWEAKVYYCE